MRTYAARRRRSAAVILGIAAGRRATSARTASGSKSSASQQFKNESGQPRSSLAIHDGADMYVPGGCTRAAGERRSSVNACIKTANRSRSAGDQRRSGGRASQASVGSQPPSGSASLRCPPEASAARCTRNPATAKNLAIRAAPVYHGGAPERRSTPMVPPDADLPEPSTAAPELPAAPPTGLEPAPLAGLVLHDPDALAAQLETYSRTRQLLVDWLFGHLVGGTDYLLIHRRLGRMPNKVDCPNKQDAKSARCEQCGGKATLGKPGSEKLCGLLRLRPRFRRDQETWEMLGSEPGVVALLCELVDAGETVVAEGRGCRHRDQDGGDVNKTIKMAAKSAQTDAVLRCAGLSEIFTQDLEDMPAVALEAEEQAAFAAPKRASERPAAEAPRSEDDRVLFDQLQDSVDEATDRRARRGHAGASRRPATGQSRPNGKTPPKEPLPQDAISPARVKRLYALLHEELREADVGDDVYEDVLTRACACLKAWVAETQGRPYLEHCSYKRYDELCAQVPRAIDAALRAGRSPRPAARFVRPRSLH